MFQINPKLPRHTQFPTLNRPVPPKILMPTLHFPVLLLSPIVSDQRINLYLDSNIAVDPVSLPDALQDQVPAEGLKIEEKQDTISNIII